MIPRNSRLFILQTIMGEQAFGNMRIYPFINAQSGDLNLKVLADFTRPAPALFDVDYIPTDAHVYSFINEAEAVNSADEGEADSVVNTFTVATTPTAPFHVYGIIIVYNNSPTDTGEILYGFCVFEDPIAVNAVGDMVKFRVNLYSNNFVPTGHL